MLLIFYMRICAFIISMLYLCFIYDTADYVGLIIKVLIDKGEDWLCCITREVGDCGDKLFFIQMLFLYL